MLLLTWPLCAAVQTAEALHYFHRAKAAYEKGEATAAGTNLALALERMPDFAEAYWLKGLLAYRAGQTDLVQAAFAHAAQDAPRLPVDEHAALAAEVADARKGLQQSVQGPFKIQSHGRVDAAKMDTAMRALQSAHQELSALLGFAPKGPAPVLVFSDDEFWDEWNVPWWAGGFFDQADGKIRFRPGFVPGGDAERDRRLKQELAAVFLQAIPARRPLPRYAVEGLSAYLSRRQNADATWIAARLSVLNDASRGAPARDVDRLSAALAAKGDRPAERYLAAIESEALVLCVAQRRGDEFVLGLIARLRHGEEFDKAFEAAAGQTPAAALTDWQSQRG
ncbi:MAG TPA: hypothetical protein VMU17_07875 [Elusimicrobiota bacterium]|nr:hypothetical protein [Elusimicrobiota bacterium]